MGLLSDPEYGSVKWVKVLKSIHNRLSLLFYASAIIWFVLLSDKEFNNETYFSENALLPGLVKNEFNAERSAKQFYHEFMTELKDKYENIEDIPVPWLAAKMSQLHLEVFIHNFTLKYPLGREQVYKGTNVYGILRAPRTSSLEALVLTAPYRPLSSHQKGTAAGIALMMAFAQFARLQKYWAKDIIFLITEHEQLGMQAWLEAYHGIESNIETFQTSLGTFRKPGDEVPDLNTYFLGQKKYEKCLDPGKLKGRSGSLQAAINLEFHSPKIRYVEVKIEGLNGQLPNLDLVNLVYKLCDNYGIHHSFKGSYSWLGGRGKSSKWINNFWNMMGMVSTQIAGVPNGNHGLFHRFGIEAITLEGRDSDDPSGQPPRVKYLSATNFYHLGILLESTFRSLNNLLERFHQSYFFYLLVATNRFVSIGQYMPSLCLLSVAMLVRALYLWVNIKQDDDRQTNKLEKESSDQKEDSEKNIKQKDDTVSDTKPDESDLEECGIVEKDSDISLKEKECEKAILEREIEDLSDEVKKEIEDINDEMNKEIEDINDEVKNEIEDIRHEVKNEIEDIRDEVKKETEKSVLERETQDENVAVKKETEAVKIFNVLGNYLLVHVLGYMVMNSPPILCYIGATHFNLSSELSVFYGFVAVSVITALTSPFYPLTLGVPFLTLDEMTYVNILALIELATTCLAIGMQNFSLGMAIAVVYAPLALCAGAVTELTRRRSLLLLKRICCLTLHPLSVITTGMILYSRVLFPEEGFLKMTSRGTDAAMQAIMFSIVDSLIYGNWLFNVATSVLFPIWIVFWQILTIEVKAKV